MFTSQFLLYIWLHFEKLIENFFIYKFEAVNDIECMYIHI